MSPHGCLSRTARTGVAYSPRIIRRICLGRLVELNFSFSTGSSAVQSPVRQRRCTFGRGFGPRSRRKTEYRAHRGNPGCADMPCRTALIQVPVQGSTHRSRSTPWRRSSSRPRDIGPGRAPRTTWLDRACSGPRHPQGYTCPPAPVAPRVNDPRTTEVPDPIAGTSRRFTTFRRPFSALRDPCRNCTRTSARCFRCGIFDPRSSLRCTRQCRCWYMMSSWGVLLGNRKSSAPGSRPPIGDTFRHLPSRRPIARRGVTHSSSGHRRRGCLQGLVARCRATPR